ncbi:hypothetical protein SAMN02745121_04274 [Nannocystis exedens]|uniref:Uncharacterized protein n=1 Tax=Nannocystis exedens TaxID=54 RepID=A0A1I2AI65_9BACT|nr:hypothetical protein [Nannocystis exedens]PCC69849.1 hypothetical protein NAEX_02876 [Nannocystis exedens]SFE43469.1 hypothetical protein SAMN02745121_04274 [Nannocystis exedens]
MPKTTPLQHVKKLFGSKDQLVARVVELLPSSFAGESAEDFKKRLKYVANSKLLRLVEVGEKAKKLGGVQAIVDKIAELKGQAKDKDYKAALAKFSVPSLVDLHQSLTRKAKQAEKAPKAEAKKSDKKKA